MEKVKIGFPDGNGVLGGIDFWNKYTSIANVETIDVSHNLLELQKISNSFFPINICLASKYRIGRALLMASLVDYMILFLHNDHYVYNCPNSVYRIKWIKAYLSLNYPKVRVIVWPFDLNEVSDIQSNIVKLTELIGGNTQDIKSFIVNINHLPSRVPAYNFNKIETGKRNIMLIGKVPFILEPYRQTTLMDTLFQSYNILLPNLINNNIISPSDTKGPNLVFYKENSIIEAIDTAVSKYELSGIILAADVFDIPGNYTFPIIKKYLRKINLPFIHVKVTLNNYNSVLNTIIESIENMIHLNNQS